MEMEVMSPSPPPTAEFNFDSACTSPYISAPSSPARFGTFFYSAPASPDRAAAFYNECDQLSPSTVPFDWEEKPGISKTKDESYDDDVDDDNDHRRDAEFSFDFSGQLDRISLPADELFDGGKIKPLKLPPRMQSKPLDSPKSPRSPKKMIKEAFHKKREFDPFEAAIEQTRKENMQEISRGRERISTSKSRHKQTRSLSPFRVSDLLFEPESNQEIAKNSSKSSLFSSSSFSSFWYKKWKIKDLLLFRSASESRATDKNEFNKYAMLKKNNLDDVKNSSFRSTDSVGSVSSRRRGPPISAHEFHYNVKRAVSEEMKKRTFLPYRQGLLGCLGFNPNNVHNMNISRGLGPSGSLSRG